MLCYEYIFGPTELVSKDLPALLACESSAPFVLEDLDWLIFIDLYRLTLALWMPNCIAWISWCKLGSGGWVAFNSCFDTQDQSWLQQKIESGNRFTVLQRRVRLPNGRSFGGWRNGPCGSLLRYNSCANASLPGITVRSGTVRSI